MDFMDFMGDTGGAAEGDQIVNEDGSGDAILFENDDTWVTE